LIAASTLAGLGTSVVATNTYDDLDRRLTFEADRGATADFRNEYTYDTLARLTQLVQKNQSGGSGVADKHVKFAYNALGQTQKITRYSNAAGTTHIGQSDFGYDKYAHLTSLDHKGPSPGLTLLTGYDWAFDHLNRVASVDFVTAGYAGEDATYSYDATDQLIGVDRSATDESYVHDLNGNRRVVGATNWSAGTNNQLFRDGTYEYTYDKEGNLTKRVTLVSGSPTGATTEYAWDNRNRLTTVTEKSTPAGSATKITKFEYDALDMRVFKNLDSDANGAANRYEYYVWDGDDIVLDFVDTDGAGGGASVALAKRYLWGQAVDQLLAEETAGGATVWDLADNLGSVRDQMDNTGGFLSGSHVNFDAFGKPTATPVSRFAFTGQEYDSDAGLYYYNARWYDPRTGKFLSEDPIEFAAGDTNLTRMLGNSVTLYVDPTGLWRISRDGGAKAGAT